MASLRSPTLGAVEFSGAFIVTTDGMVVSPTVSGRVSVSPLPVSTLKAAGRACATGWLTLPSRLALLSPPGCSFSGLHRRKAPTSLEVRPALWPRWCPEPPPLPRRHPSFPPGRPPSFVLSTTRRYIRSPRPHHHNGGTWSTGAPSSLGGRIPCHDNVGTAWLVRAPQRGPTPLQLGLGGEGRPLCIRASTSAGRYLWLSPFPSYLGPENALKSPR